MITKTLLLQVADAYQAITGLPDEKTVSSRVFADSKKLSSLRVEGDITLSRFNAAMRWFDENWPAGAERPVALTTYLRGMQEDAA